MSSNMEGSSTLDDSAASADSSRSKHLPFPPPRAPLLRMESGSSVVLDDEHEQVQHDAACQKMGFQDCVMVADVAESRKLPSSQYKGVVPQPNGRWGAQIYEKHHRVWLGTFDSEAEAASAYDVAACRFRGRDAITNFAPVDDEPELEFIGSRSKAEIVDMLRKHTYRDELSQSKRSRSGGPHKRKTSSNKTEADREPLFEKIVTPSDVGKLNRLVIPKQHAEKHFPLKTGSLLLSFEDECGKVWRFRYSYWNSSQSYVLTKGWSRFVKEKGLKAGGAVVFQKATGAEKQLFIQCKLGAEIIRPVQLIRLFGVNISQVPIKIKETEFLPSPKKQCVRDQ